ALRARDDAGNVSGLSNVLVATTSNAPGRVLDLEGLTATDSSVTLRWTATGDNAPPGRPASYRVIASETPIPDPSVLAVPLERDVAASAPAGGIETFAFTGLAHAHLYYFAVVAIDVDA